jgi:2-polyprenyl-3-methyl-5-hydroxy-6-metoxy-1,4-benzoquinol methylase
MPSRDGARRALLRGALARAHALSLAYHLRDLWRSMAYIGRRAEVGEDGLPVPSPNLIHLVAGTPESAWFLYGGRLAADSIRQALAKNGVELDSMRSILDFGCGCGRVVRNWARLPAQVHGSDSNGRLIRWCRRHLPFATFATNRPHPPLPYGDGQFDLVYALSVFTHLPAHMQRPWMEELNSRFEAGELVVRGADAPGRNECGAYHPAAYVQNVLAAGFRLMDHLPQGARGNPHQDLVVLRKDLMPSHPAVC